MKSVIYLIILSCIVGVTFYSCYYNNDEQLNTSVTTCDTTNITYAARIAPIFNANCMACHGSSVYRANGGGVNLQDYANQKANIEMIYLAVYNGIMPKTGAKLDNCSIKAIKIWKDAGAPNN